MFMRYRKGACDVYALFNEGEQAIEGQLTVAAVGQAEWWDPLRGTRLKAESAPSIAPAGPRQTTPHLSLPLRLERRESRLPVVGAGGTDLLQQTSPQLAVAPQPPTPFDLTDWQVTRSNGSRAPIAQLGDWTQVRELERYSGTLVYTTQFDWPKDVALPIHAEVDLGQVGEAAVVFANGQNAGFAMWSPYRVAVPPNLWRPGPNVVTVQVTNSAANYYEGAMRPSGLMGPVSLLIFDTREGVG